MKIDVSLILSIILAGGLVAFVFTVVQISTERQRLNGELETRSIKMAEEFYQNNTYMDGSLVPLDNIADSVIANYGFQTIAVYYNADSIVVKDSAYNRFLSEGIDYSSRAVVSEQSSGTFITDKGEKYYLYTRVVSHRPEDEKAIIFFTDAEYIEAIISNIWFRNFFRWFVQAMLISGITLVIVRKKILSPLNKVVEWVKAARYGNMDKIEKTPPPTEFLSPIYKEISSIANAMQEAKAIASEEARLRTSAESVWTSQRLNEEMKNLLGKKQLVIVSNREPYMHRRVGNEIECIVPASGMVTAMEPILKACGGLWIASGSGDADRETADKDGKLLVPPYEDIYTLKRVWLTKEQEHHYYYGFSNEGLWPLCHIAHTRPVFRKIDWDYYKEVNELFGQIVLKEIEDKEEPFVLVQDYHFALLPEIIKKARPDARVAIFWHIPWPNAESFGICPWKKEILQGMLGADLIGFHTQYHCNNFLETVNQTLESRVIWENFSVKMGNHFTLVKPFPIGIAFTSGVAAASENGNVDLQALLKPYGVTCKYMGIGVDRVDYTKGLIEKCLSIERFMEKNPEYVGELVFVQIGAPSRILLKTYADTFNMVEQEVNRINSRFRTKTWQPILYLKTHHSHEQIIPFYKAANFCMVTSLHDGMNLVAKEYIASRCDDKGVLILSQFAGASQELHASLLVNPYDIEQTSEAILSALTMSNDIQTQRMKQMRRLIMRHNVYAWGASILRTMDSIEN
jgi:trehalose 6-phosphate synthase